MRKITLLVIVLSILSFVAIGCQKQQIQTETEATEQEQEVTQEVPETEPEVTIEEEVETTDIADRSETKEMEVELITDVYFDFDSYTIKEEYKSELMAVANSLLDTNRSILIEGHCDDRGTNEYNLALGDRRANAAKNFLKASGVPANRLETISFGEDKPVCGEANESCWSRNRRAHIVFEGSR